MASENSTSRSASSVAGNRSAFASPRFLRAVRSSSTATTTPMYFFTLSPVALAWMFYVVVPVLCRLGEGDDKSAVTSAAAEPRRHVAPPRVLITDYAEDEFSDEVAAGTMFLDEEESAALPRDDLPLHDGAPGGSSTAATTRTVTPAPAVLAVSDTGVTEEVEPTSAGQ
ncbi:unnamed protein product, partial [Amoebophrya sp. A120]|eukprot:GSA120T00005942001.1